MTSLPSVLILHGGFSHEREVSLLTGQSVNKTLQEAGYHTVLADLTAPQQLEPLLDQHAEKIIFNALHGTFGEDGTLPQLLNQRKQPYTHSGEGASRLAFHKPSLQKKLLEGGLPHASFIHFLKGQSVPMPSLPAVAKPAADGSSIEIHLLETPQKWEAFLNHVTTCPITEWIIEDYIPGQELTVSVLKDQPLAITEVKSSHAFFDYQEKYLEKTPHLLPAPLDPTLYEEIKTLALSVHRLVGCRTLSRTDIRYNPQNGQIAILEINTHPGLTDVSLLPEQAAFKGYTFQDVLEILLQDAQYGD